MTAAGARPRVARSFAVAVLAALLIGSSFGCQTARVVDAGTPIDPDDAHVRALLRELRDTSSSRNSLRGRARLSLDAPQLRFSRPQRMALQAPASLRIEVLGLFDQVAGIVATDGETFGYVDVLSKTRDAGPVDDGLLWRTARVDLTPTEAVSLLLGAPPLDPGAGVVRAVRFADGGVGALVTASDAAHWLEWDEAGGLRRAELRGPCGDVRWNARFADRRDVDGTSFAHSIELEFARVEATARIQYDAVELEPALSAGLFVLQVAPGE